MTDDDLQNGLKIDSLHSHVHEDDDDGFSWNELKFQMKL